MLPPENVSTKGWAPDSEMGMWRFQCNVGKLGEVIMLPTVNGSQISGNSISAGHVEISGAILVNQGGGIMSPTKNGAQIWGTRIGFGHWEMSCAILVNQVG
jgi:hypothetical protein